MARALLLPLVLTSAVIIFSICPQGTARMVHVMRHYGTGNFSPVALKEDESRSIVGEMMASEMDYAAPGANTNPRSAPIFNTATPPASHP